MQLSMKSRYAIDKEKQRQTDERIAAVGLVFLIACAILTCGAIFGKFLYLYLIG